MDDDFERALNKFNSRFRFHLKESVNKIKELQNINDKQEEEKKNKLKEDLELHYIHYTNTDIYQRKLTLPLGKKCSKLNNYSDKVILPVSVLKILEKERHTGDVEHPYTFCIKHLDNSYITHAGVLEFSSEEGIILVSENIKENLQLNRKYGTTRLLVTYVNLPKGKFIKFESVNDTIGNMICMKHLMENYLSMNYTTLTVGDIVYIDKLHFYVKELEPDNAVTLVNSDIEVDICKSDKKKTNSFFINSVEVCEEINTLSSVNTKISKDLKRFKFFINHNSAQLWKKGKSVLELVLLPENIKYTNLQIFIAFPPYDNVSEILHHAFFTNVNKIVINKELIVKCLKTHFLCFLKEEEQFVESIIELFFPHVLYIGISSVDKSQSDVTFFLQWVKNEEETIKQSIEQVTEQKEVLNTMRSTCLENVVYKQCSNCLKDIVESNFVIHQVHCTKNITLCKICKQALNKKELGEHIHCDICNDVVNPLLKNIHFNLWHTKIKCVCGKDFYRKEFIFHQKLFCTKKFSYCSYCNIFTTSSINSVNEEQVLSFFFQKFEEKKNFQKKDAFKYYTDMLYTNWNFFVEFIKTTEHEQYCGTKSVNCALCEKQIYRNEYMEHLNEFHQLEKVKSFQILSDNIDVVENTHSVLDKEK